MAAGEHLECEGRGPAGVIKLPGACVWPRNLRILGGPILGFRPPAAQTAPLPFQPQFPHSESS